MERRNSQLLVICCGREGGGVNGRGIPSREGAVESRGHSLRHIQPHAHTHSHANTHMNTFRQTHAGGGCVATGEREGERYSDRGDPWQTEVRERKDISQRSVFEC